MAIWMQAPRSRPPARTEVVRPAGIPPDCLSRIDWTGRRVTVMGLGRHGGGVAAARFLAQRGARVTISDCASETQLAESMDELRDVAIVQYQLGGHDEADFRTAEFVVVNPAVRSDHACLHIAREAGARLISEIELFLAQCPAQVIGVTGSNGKSTTSAMLAHILKTSGRRTWLGGNFGNSLLGELDSMTRHDWVVLELSSFQLAHLSEHVRWPQFCVVTNCSENHLDWHGTWESYTSAKQRLITQQDCTGVVVLNDRDPEVASWRGLTSARVHPTWPPERIPPLLVPGEHSRQNAACAATAAEAAGVDERVIIDSLSLFRGLEHRLQLVGELDGRRFYNDSKSTTPAATIAALSAIEGPVWLLAGGHAKGTSFEELAATIARRARGAALFGAARDALAVSLHIHRADFCASSHEHLADALRWAWRQSRPGEAILLSPACASFDQYRDFSERGASFCGLVQSLSSEFAEASGHAARE